MYRRCIYCSARLGDNESLPGFPVGERIAFDPGRGRLWAICPRCARWNLAPLEERWEPVEQAERLFRATRLRVQRDHVGIARLPDGARLLRIGQALPGEVAAWRYGDELVARWRRRAFRLRPAAPARLRRWLEARGWSGAVAGLLSARADRRLVGYLAADRSPTGADLALLRGHLRGAVLEPGGEGPALHLPAASTPALPRRIPGLWAPGLHEPMLLPWTAARETLARTLVDVNARGAPHPVVAAALDSIAAAGGSAAYLRKAAARRTTVQLPHRAPRAAGDWDGYWNRRAEREEIPGEARAAWRAQALGTVCGLARHAPQALALEMALHEEVERRALEGELSVLRAAWREAEEIAALADRLVLADPGGPAPPPAGFRSPQGQGEHA